MKEIRELVTSITSKTNGKYCERLIKIFENLTDYDSEIIATWLKSIDDKL
jgi:hypothetical protein